MSFTCKNCNGPLTAGIRLCPNCGLVFDQPVPAVTAYAVRPYAPAAPARMKKTNPAWAVALVLTVSGLGMAALVGAGCGRQPTIATGTGGNTGAGTNDGGITPPPPPPPPPTSGNLVGSWTSNIVYHGVTVQEVYTFNSDGSFSETDTSQAGQSATTGGTYSYTGDQVTINFSNGQQEQATVAWDNPNQMHYKITQNPDAGQVGMDIVRTRQTSGPTPAGGTANSTSSNGPVINVDEIAQAYQDNPLRADATYKGKVLTFVGRVTDDNIDISPYYPEGATLILTSGVGHNGIGFDGQTHWFAKDIHCIFPDVYKDQLVSVNKGDTVTIQGVCIGIDSAYLSFENCHIVSKP